MAKWQDENGAMLRLSLTMTDVTDARKDVQLFRILERKGGSLEDGPTYAANLQKAVLCRCKSFELRTVGMMENKYSEWMKNVYLYDLLTNNKN